MKNWLEEKWLLKQDFWLTQTSGMLQNLTENLLKHFSLSNPLSIRTKTLNLKKDKVLMVFHVQYGHFFGWSNLQLNNFILPISWSYKSICIRDISVLVTFINTAPSLDQRKNSFMRNLMILRKCMWVWSTKVQLVIWTQCYNSGSFYLHSERPSLKYRSAIKM